MKEYIIKMIFFGIPVSMWVHDLKLLFLFMGLLGNGLNSKGMIM